MEQIRIRNMEEADIPAVLVVEQENFSIPWSEKSFRDMLQRPESLFLVAERAFPEESGGVADSEVLGYAGAVVAGAEGDVTNIAVLCREKQKGIATVLLKHLIRETITAGVQDLFLEVREHNTPALRLYEAAGFVPVGRRKGYYDKPKEDAVLMKKTLP